MVGGVRVDQFDYTLPPELIAQAPAPSRDQSRLLVLDRMTGSLAHRVFRELPSLLHPGDLLILNDSRVIPARLRATKKTGGAHVEVLLLEENGPLDWWAMLRPGKRVRVGTRLTFLDHHARPAALHAVACEKNSEGHVRLDFSGTPDLQRALEHLGEVPLPPYIERAPFESRPEDRDRYQTVYAEASGSVAAPTAGLHFTRSLLDHLTAHGVELHCVTLHVGVGTFAPVKVDRIASHHVHEERFAVPVETADAINAAKAERRRIVAVGTTTVRVLEHLAAIHGGRVAPTAGRTSLFIHPPYRFRIVDALITNFHLPRSTLLMLVSAFAAPGSEAGRDQVLRAYAEAIRLRYRFFSYGDAMFLYGEEAPARA